MRWHTRLTLALLFLLGVATSLWANAGPRFVPPMPPAAPKLVVEVDEKATDARLVIPRQFLIRRAELESDEPQEKQKAALPLPKIMVGLSLALAVSFSGLWLVRRKGVTGRGLAGVLALAVLVAGSGYLFADLLPRPNPPRDFKPPVVKPPPVEEAAPLLPFLAITDNLKIEIAERGDVVRLIVNGDQKSKLGEKPVMPEKPEGPKGTDKPRKDLTAPPKDSKPVKPKP